MTDYALDYSAGWPTPAAVKAAGYLGAIRYIGFPGRPKCIGQAEYDAFTRAGLGVALVYENQAGDMLGGREAGRTAARTALVHATSIGFPVNSRPIYYACDTDIVTAAQFAAVLDYLRGAAEVHGGPGRVGVYGEADVIERAAAAGVAAWFWQTKAWSHGIVSDHDHLLQVLGQVTVGGVVCDRNEIHRPDWGQTGAPTAQPATPPPPEGHMYLATRDDGAAVLVQPHSVRLVSAAGRAALAKLGVPVTAGRFTDAELAAMGDAMGDGPADPSGDLAALAKTLAGVAAQVAAQSDDEARVLAALAGSEARLAAALLAEG